MSTSIAGLIAAGLVAATLTTAVEAATITYKATSSCTANCAAAGLALGDAVDARITLDISGFTPGSFIENADVVDFVVRFGHTIVSKANAAGFSIFGSFGATVRRITDLDFIGATAELPDIGNGFAFLTGETGAATITGACANPACGILDVGDPAGTSPVSVAPVPLPAGLLLAATAVASLLGASFGARRRFD